MKARPQHRPRPRRRMLLRIAAVQAALSLSLGLTTTFAANAAPTTGSTPRPPIDTAGLQRDLDALITNGDVAAVAKVRDANEPSWTGTAGVADLRTGAPVDATGKIHIASVTKTFVATVLLQLAGEGRVRLDETIDHYVPGIPEGNVVTLRQILNHTSGYYDFTHDHTIVPDWSDPAMNQAWLDQGRWKTWSARDLVNRAIGPNSGHSPTNRPGEAQNYSNTNYLIAGLIIENVTGKSYSHEIERRILRPLHLRDTSFAGTSPTIRSPFAHTYLVTPTGPQDATTGSWTVLRSAGEMISTTNDLIRFDQALLSGRLLRPAELREMKTVYGDDSTGIYGLGLHRLTLTCGPIYGHTGGGAGWETWMFGTPDANRQLALAISTLPGNQPAHEATVTQALEHTFCPTTPSP
ncbi:serine hydrolase domain-containing protein [Embleya sp. AB8]|uniref:serine hydrolase domain-containing protein n=1 Tax=Embleya sp. AB8 TaxID=3156304 RepID=UPI003C728008